MRYVNLSNDTGNTPTRSAILTIDAVGQSIVMPPGSRAWVQWSAFFPGHENDIARLDWLVVTFAARVHPFDPRDLRHHTTGAMELELGAQAVELRVSGIPAGARSASTSTASTTREPAMITLDEDFILAVAPRVSGRKRDAQRAIVTAIAPVFESTLRQYKIDTVLRVAHFMGQVTKECDGFLTTVEYGTGDAYQGRLGNIHPGDGRRYKGRGLIQLTGRANYRQVGGLLGLPLEDQPELAADPVTSLRIACEYWKDRAINGPADADDIVKVTKRVNGGDNGLADRIKFYRAARTLLTGFTLAPDLFAKPPPPPVGVRLPMRAVTLANDDGSTIARTAVLTIDGVGTSIVMPTGARAWVQWSAFFPGHEDAVATADPFVVSLPGRDVAHGPLALRHRGTGAFELDAGAVAVAIRVSGIPSGGAVTLHLDGIGHA